MSTTLHKLIIKNFKQFDDIEIELGNTVVFVGPNNSGKTTALQALSLWYIGVQKWLTNKGDKTTTKRTRVPINRKDLYSIPNINARMLWRNLTTQKQNTKKDEFDIIIILEGITDNQLWRCGMEFRFNNDEALYCQPIKDQDPLIPEEAQNIKVAFLPIMAGLSVIEPRVDPDYIEMMIGEGQTAQVLRNMCYLVYQTPHWNKLVNTIKELFGITLQTPLLERGTISLAYKTPQGTTLDLLASGSGLRQTLLILAHLYLNPNVILLLDEPDAHLEILRQRQIYDLINDIAKQQHSQVIMASHSEIIMDKAAETDIIIAFVGKPHRMDKRKDEKGHDPNSQLRKALREITWDNYYRAEIKGWVLYLEGETDLRILSTIAKLIKHRVSAELEDVFFHSIYNQPNLARQHFYGLCEAKSDLVGIVIVDKVDKELKKDTKLNEMMWGRREIENYLIFPEVFELYAGHNINDSIEKQKRESLMKKLVEDSIPAIALRDRNHRWWYNTKMSDDFLDPLFEVYFASLNLPNLMLKTNYHILANFLTLEQVDSEIIEKLDAIYEVAQRAKPRE